MKPANPYPPYLQASNIGKATDSVQKEIRSIMATPPKQYTEAEQNAFSLDTMLNGGTCDTCQ
jgi:ribonucleoside-diphosphate reductase alpha chain